MAHPEDPLETQESATALDASFKIDPSALADDEADFANALGFGSEPTSSPASSSTSKSAAEPLFAPPSDDSAAAFSSSDPDEPDLDLDPEEPPTFDNPPYEPAEMEIAHSDADEWESISPRPSSEGIQDLLRTRAEEVLVGSPEEDLLEPLDTLATDDNADTQMDEDFSLDDLDFPESLPSHLDDSATRIADLEQTLAERDTEIQSLTERRDTLENELRRTREAPPADAERQAIEKAMASLRAELDTTATERDQVIDQLAVSSGQLVQAQGRIERLEGSLRSSRGALSPLPEGERLLRAEVIGLRGRLDEASQENGHLTAEIASVATELAIATALIEDRQHEIDDAVERARRAELELADNEKRLDEALHRHRVALDLATRLRAENAELRIAQTALENTLQARDLEIAARGEQLRVTRDGLELRDRQMTDLQATLDERQQNATSLNAELERALLERQELSARIARREDQIAQLTQTLDRIGEAMGRPVHVSTDPAPETSPSSTGARPDLGGDLAPTRNESPPITPPTPDMSDTLCLTPPSASPAMLSDWRDRRLEALNATTPSVSSFLADQLVELIGTSGPMPLHIASLGGSLPDAELHLCQALQSRGFEEVRIDVLDASESNAEARRCVVEKAGLEESIRIQVGDLTDWDINPALQVFLVSDVLFAQTDPNAVLEQICARLPGHGVLLFVGHIGSGPIQLSETALKRFEDLWELMPARLSEREAFQKAPEVGDDGGFLIPLQPTAPLLQSRFNARALVGFGHLADLVVGPERGFELMPEDPDARQFVEAVQAIDESRITTESLPPRHGVGVFVTGPCEAPLRLGQAWPQANADA